MGGLLFLDGAMGTMLQAFGLGPGECSDLANISHPEWVQEIHRAYVRAGADIVEANTFGANAIKLGDYGLAARAREINREGIKLAREATKGTGVLVAASIGPTGRLLAPFGDLSHDACYEAFAEQARVFRDAGADIVSIETMFSLEEARCALIAARDVSGLPVMCHLSFERGGRTLMGDEPAAVASACEALGAFAVGANCSTGPSSMVEIIRAMAEVSGIPISAEPNAGLPEVVDGIPVYAETPKAMAEHAEALVRAGASIIGGCCGTTPDHIRAIRHRLQARRGADPAASVLRRMRERRDRPEPARRPDPGQEPS